MTERRRVWSGRTRFALALAYFGLALGVGFGLAQSSGPATGLGAATLVAAALLVALSAMPPSLIPLLAGRVQPMAGAAGGAPPVLIRSVHPDSAGRARPRAPGRFRTARAA